MKQKVCLLAAVMCMLFSAACSAQDTAPFPPAESDVPESTDVFAHSETSRPTAETETEAATEPPAASIPAYEDVCRTKEAWLRQFYDHEGEYCIKAVESKEMLSSIGTILNGWFDGEALAAVEVAFYGEMCSVFQMYYILSEDLVYVTSCRAEINSTEEFREYYIYKGNLLQYDDDSGCLIACPDEDAHEIYEIARREILGEQEFIAVSAPQTGTGTDALYRQCSDLKNKFFRDFYENGKQYGVVSCQVDSLGFQFRTSKNCIAVFEGETLRNLNLRNQLENDNFTRYEYYPLNETHTYVLVLHQTFKEGNGTVDDLTGARYEDYYIVNGTVMQYDAKAQAMTACPDFGELAAWFETASAAVHTE